MNEEQKRIDGLVEYAKPLIFYIVQKISFLSFETTGNRDIRYNEIIPYTLGKSSFWQNRISVNPENRLRFFGRIVYNRRGFCDSKRANRRKI